MKPHRTTMAPAHISAVEQFSSFFASDSVLQKYGANFTISTRGSIKGQ